MKGLTVPTFAKRENGIKERIGHQSCPVDGFQRATNWRWGERLFNTSNYRVFKNKFNY